MGRFGSRFKNAFLWKILLAVLVIMGSAALDELYDLNDALSAPFSYLAAWQTNSVLFSRLKFVILFILYVSPLVLLNAWLWSRFQKEDTYVEKYNSPYDYDKLIAELVQAVTDRTVFNDVRAEKVNLLFNALIDDFCTLYRVERGEVRAVLVSNDRGREKLTGWRWGRPITPEQERMDLKAISMFLETEKTYPTWIDAKDHFPNGDSDTLLFIRNKGEQLHLGCLIAVSKPVNTGARIREWEQIVYPLTMLGHMDKLVRFVVNYK